jgi:hypothetical protein
MRPPAREPPRDRRLPGFCRTRERVGADAGGPGSPPRAAGGGLRFSGSGGPGRLPFPRFGAGPGRRRRRPQPPRPLPLGAPMDRPHARLSPAATCSAGSPRRRIAARPSCCAPARIPAPSRGRSASALGVGAVAEVLETGAGACGGRVLHSRPTILIWFLIHAAAVCGCSQAGLTAWKGRDVKSYGEAVTLCIACAHARLHRLTEGLL